MKYDFDAIVIGAGHAGVEAALSLARTGHNTAVVMLDKNKIASMPCNPSIGGPAKGIVVREIDALGGEMAKAADATALQMKLLNSSRGPAVWAIRAQSDKIAYSKYMQKQILNQDNLTVLEVMVNEILINDNKEAHGIVCEDGKVYQSKVIILTTGTFMDSLTLQGMNKKIEGPENQRTTNKLSKQLSTLGFNLVRLKTGTPPRIQRDSIDFTKTSIEPGSDLPLAFSSSTKSFLPLSEQLPCYLIHTNQTTHKLINANLNKSPMYNGLAQGTGPRYCPSIEDKVVRFSDKPKHQIFLEPESKDLDTIYVQGFSTSLPIEVQDQMLRTLPGLENCVVAKWAYAIEYDAIEPTQLLPTLETKLIKNLYTAGQINGTSGYEEAACQGLMAGINAHLKLTNQAPLILGRDEAYIGVLIDDLITKGTKEPYRLLTSLAEHRLLLRNDNANTRLREYGYKSGLVREDDYQSFLSNQVLMRTITEELKAYKASPRNELGQILINQYQFSVPDNKISVYELLRRPETNLRMFKDVIPNINQLSYHEQLELEISIKFIGYIDQQQKLASKMQSLEKKQLPIDLNYDDVFSLTLQAREKLKQIQPRTIGQASRISGVSPADIQMLLVFLKKTYPSLNAN